MYNRTLKNSIETKINKRKVIILIGLGQVGKQP